jgi:hypothetical protein
MLFSKVVFSFVFFCFLFMERIVEAHDVFICFAFRLAVLLFSVVSSPPNQRGCQGRRSCQGWSGRQGGLAKAEGANTAKNCQAVRAARSRRQDPKDCQAVKAVRPRRQH